MPSPSASPSQSPPPGTAGHHSSAASRARLTESEKKSNHIASEQKRRMAIREGFDKLTEIVPGIEGMGRSESLVLQKTVEYMRGLMAEEGELKRRVGELGGNVEEAIGKQTVPEALKQEK